MHAILQTDSVRIAGRQEGVLDIFREYMQLQLMVRQVNITFRDLLIPGTIAMISNLGVFSLYVTVRLHGVIPMPGFLFFPLLLSDTVLVIAIDFASAGFVYMESKNIVTEWQKNSSFRTRKKSMVHTKARSFSPLKFQFGMNFIDELTSFTVLDYCLNQTVSLLLMS